MKVLLAVMAILAGCGGPYQQTSYAKDLSLPAYSTTLGLSKTVYNKAVIYYSTVRNQLSNKRYLTIVDFSMHSDKDRLFLFDLKTGTVEKRLVSHGSGSDPDDTGFATKFSNITGSRMSSLGGYVTTDIGSYRGYSLTLQGLDKTNSRAESRGILMHQAPYVNEANKHVGRSWGCLVLDPRYAKSIIDRIAGGSLIYVGW